MKTYHFHKMHGAGNDFVFLDCMGTEPIRLTASDVRYLCDRHFGVGADGVAVLRRSDLAQAGWDFTNSDGSGAEMCGNAARCAILYLADRYFPGQAEPITLETRAGIISGRKLGENAVEITMMRRPSGGFAIEEKAVAVKDEVFNVTCVNTGVPHAVIEVKDLATYPIARIGKALVSHPAFAPHGSNITFFQRVAGARILSTTFERGVEAETFACWTGVAAAAIVFSELYLRKFPIEVVVPGGELSVDVDSATQGLKLEGPAMYVMEGNVLAPPSNHVERSLYGERKKHS